jgi:hypothetical protein
MNVSTYAFALSDQGVSNLSHQLAAITLARKRRFSARRRHSAAARLVALLAAGASFLAAALMTG